MLYVIIALSSVIFLLHRYGVWNRNYWRKRNVPCTEPWAFVGDLKEALLGKEHISKVYLDIYKKFPGCRYVGIYDMRTPAIMIRDPELVKDILQNDFNTFSVNNFNVNADIDPLLANNPFFNTGDEWKTMRSHMTQHMTPSKLKVMVPHMDTVAHNMMEYLNARPSEDIECKNLTGRYTTDVIASAVLSLSSNSFLDTPSLFFKITQSLFDGDRSFWTSLQQFFFFTSPALANLFRMRFISNEIEAAVLKITVNGIEQRIKSKEVRNDFFQTVIALREKDPKTFTDVYIAAEILGFLLDGFETSSAAMSLTLFELASNPHIQGRARNEINEVLEKHNGTFTYDNIAELQYLDMVVSESLRRYPQAFLQKKSTAKYTLPPARPDLKPLTIEKGTGIVIPTVAIHTDAELFPDPENFDPERFNAENRDSINRFANIPFGEGPRVCLGMKLATTQMKVGLARLIENFEIRVSPKCPKKPLKADPNFLIIRPLGGVWLTFNKINKN